MKTMFIQHVELTADQKSDLAQVMVAGNSILKSAHAKAKTVALRLQSNPRYPRSLFRNQLFKALDMFTQHRKGGRDIGVAEMPNGILQYGAFLYNNGSIDVYGSHLSAEDLKALALVRFNESRILASCAKMISKEARRWVGQIDGQEFADLYQEVCIAAVNCIYGYSKAGVKFSTYLQNALHRRMINVMSENYGGHRLTNEQRTLMVQYNKSKQMVELERGGQPVCFEEMVKLMGLKPKQIARLSQAFKRSIVESDIAFETGDDKDSRLLSSIEDHREHEIKFDEGSILNKIEFTEWEKLILTTYLDSNNGKERYWQKKLEGHVNPQTQKPYSRQGVALCLNRIFTKIRSFQEHEQAA
jgi:hypothetical protein